MQCHEEVLLTLRRIVRAIDLRSRQLMQTVGLTGPQLSVLRTIDHQGEIAAGKLAAEIHLSQGTLTTILERLERRGLIARRRCKQDKRRVLCTLTTAGQEVLASVPTPLQDDFVASFQRLAEWEQTLMLSSLQRVAEMLNAQQLEVAPNLETTNLDDADVA